MRGPRILTWFATERCNARCPFCCAGSPDVPGSTARDELRPDELALLAETMDPLDLLIVTGGDPLLRDDLEDGVAALCLGAPARRAAILTSGWSPKRTEALVKGLLARCPRSRFTVSLSIDVWGPEHDRMRGVPGLFDRLLETYERLEPLRRSSGGRLSRGIAIRYGADTEDTVEDTMNRVLEELAPDTLSLTLDRVPAARPQTTVRDLDRYLRLSRVAADHSVHRDVARGLHAALGPAATLLARAKSRAIVRAVRRDVPFGPCEAGRLIGVLHADGTVNACEHLPEAIGNVRDGDLDFRRAWDTQANRDVRRDFLRAKCRCTHECFVTPTLVSHPVSLARALFGPTSSPERED
ncbi:MAG: radical SAM/SPASM domain-containing protein [Myxococcota bacterium]